MSSHRLVLDAMRRDEKEFLGNVLSMAAVAWFFHSFVEVPLHEYGHYWAASMLGVPAFVEGERTFWGMNEAVSPPASALISLAGGLCAAALLVVLFFLMRRPYRFSLLPLIAANLAYAPFDSQTFGSEVGLVAMLLVWFCVFGMFLVRFVGGWPAGRRGVPGMGFAASARGRSSPRTPRPRVPAG